MGFSSFKTNHGVSISNKHSAVGTRPVKMLDNIGNEYIETDYDGCMNFNGIDYNHLLARMNSMTLDEYLSLSDSEVSTLPLKKPRFAEIDDNRFYNQLLDPISCVKQGINYTNKESEELEKYNQNKFEFWKYHKVHYESPLEKLCIDNFVQEIRKSTCKGWILEDADIIYKDVNGVEFGQYLDTSLKYEEYYDLNNSNHKLPESLPEGNLFVDIKNNKLAYKDDTYDVIVYCENLSKPALFSVINYYENILDDNIYIKGQEKGRDFLEKNLKNSLKLASASVKNNISFLNRIAGIYNMQQCGFYQSGYDRFEIGLKYVLGKDKKPLWQHAEPHIFWQEVGVDIKTGTFESKDFELSIYQANLSSGNEETTISERLEIFELDENIVNKFVPSDIVKLYNEHLKQKEVFEYVDDEKLDTKPSLSL